jgi:hypothetical protein
MSSPSWVSSESWRRDVNQMIISTACSDHAEHQTVRSLNQDMVRTQFSPYILRNKQVRSQPGLEGLERQNTDGEKNKDEPSSTDRCHRAFPRLEPWGRNWEADSRWIADMSGARQSWSSFIGRLARHRR